MIRKEIAAGIVEVFKPRGRLRRAVRRHVLGVWRFLFVVHILAFLLICPVAMVGIFFARETDLGNWAVLPTFGVTLALILAHRGINRWADRRMARRFTKLGLELDSKATFEVTASGLVISTEAVSSTVAWRSITKVWREKGDWVLLLRTGAAVVLPPYIFESDEAEWAFMTLLFDMIDPEVRARSRQVNAFEGPGPVARV
ncbi:MAG: YcxB family protein [Enhydrobacter sp.]|nr:YcxB family protein [Enhydrobacter sp.]